MTLFRFHEHMRRKIEVVPNYKNAYLAKGQNVAENYVNILLNRSYSCGEVLRVSKAIRNVHHGYNDEWTHHKRQVIV